MEKFKNLSSEEMYSVNGGQGESHDLEGSTRNKVDWGATLSFVGAVAGVVSIVAKSAVIAVVSGYAGSEAS